MRILGGRSLAFSCFSFITFLFLSKYIPEHIRRSLVLPFFCGATVFFAVSAVLFFLKKRGIAKKTAATAFAILAASAALLLCLFTVDRDIRTAGEYDGTKATLKVEITQKIAEYSYYSAYLGRAVSLDGESADIGKA